jgi:hypothetical protein
MWFFNLAEQAYLEQDVHFSPIITLKGRQYSIEKLTQFSQGNEEIDSPPSNLDGFLCTDTCVSSIQLNRPVWSNLSISPSWKPCWPGSIPFKN